MRGVMARVVQTVLRTRKSLVVDDYKNSELYDPLEEVSNVGSIMCVPIMHMVRG